MRSDEQAELISVLTKGLGGIMFIVEKLDGSSGSSIG
jgi:hypothetical protein